MYHDMKYLEGHVDILDVEEFIVLDLDCYVHK